MALPVPGGHSQGHGLYAILKNINKTKRLQTPYIYDKLKLTE
jgi:hypothetical protein